MTYEAKLVIARRGQVLACRQEGQITLPSVEVEQGRIGISLSKAVRQQLNLEIFCLVLPDSASSYAAAGDLHVMRLQSSRSELGCRFIWVNPAELPNEDELPALLGRVEATADDFGGYAWYECVEAWLNEQVARLGYSLRGLEQWNGRVGGVLLRVITSGPDFWFKAVSDINVREFRIAQILSAKHPAFFPRVVAQEPGWNALLLQHVEGTELYVCDDLAVWKDTARLLADIQMDWVGDGAGLDRAEAADLRAGTIAAKLPQFLDYIDDAMTRQPKTPPARLTRVDLSELANALYALCTEVACLDFAEGLANADFSPHNTLITQRGPVFIDWAEACVSLPLIAGEYMWNRMAVESPNRTLWQGALRDAYLSEWAKGYGGRPVERAARWLPGFAVLAVAIFYFEGKGRSGSYDSYLRSLTRRLAKWTKEMPTESYLIEA
jgi:hypothetical protein